MELKNKKNIVYLIFALIIIIGVTIICTKGFNKELRFAESQKIDIYLDQKVDAKKIKEITNEVLGKENIVQKIELYEDMITIRANSITEEQKNNIVAKIKENYTFEQTADKVTIDNVPVTRIRDMYKGYINTMIIASILIIIYFAIRYYKKGVLSVIFNSLFVPTVIELTYISLVAILRIPVGRFLPIIGILIYILTIFYLETKFKGLEEK